MSLTLYTVAAGALAAAGILAYRILWPAREPRTEPVSRIRWYHGTFDDCARICPGCAVRHAALGAALRLPVVSKLVERGRAEPGHVGATEEWSPTGEMAAVVAQPSTAPAPDWDADRWELDVHAALNKLEDDFHADVEHFWGWVYDRLGVDAKTRLRLASSVEQTGEWDRAELDAMLEGASA